MEQESKDRFSFRKGWIIAALMMVVLTVVVCIIFATSDDPEDLTRSVRDTGKKSNPHATRKQADSPIPRNNPQGPGARKKKKSRVNFKKATTKKLKIIGEKVDQLEVLSERMTQLEEGQTEIKAMLSKLLDPPTTPTPTSPTPTAPTECPSCFQFLSGTQKCFRMFGTETLTWSAASDACNALSGGTRLLTLETEDMYLAFEDFFRIQYLPRGPSRGCWLGGQEVSAEYRWLSGAPLSYTNHWLSGYGQVTTGLKLGIKCNPARCGLFNRRETYNAHYACEIY